MYNDIPLSLPERNRKFVLQMYNDIPLSLPERQQSFVQHRKNSLYLGKKELLFLNALKAANTKICK